MRKIKTRIQEAKSNPKSLGYEVYCTIDGVVTPIVYQRSEFDGSLYYETVNVTKSKRLRRQKSLTGTKSLLTPVKQNGATILPICVFDYDYGVTDSSNNVIKWISSYDRSLFEQSTSANQPSLGVRGGGVNGFTPIYFNRSESDFMLLNSPITITGDFTMFFYIEPVAVPIHKQYRLLGKSDDNDMYLSIGEGYNETYNLSFSSSSEVVVSTTGYWQPSSRKLLITIQRSGSNVYIRENGTQIHTGTTPTSDFTFDQIGKIGNIAIPTFSGSMYHFSAYDGYITTRLSEMENSIIKKAALAKE